MEKTSTLRVLVDKALSDQGTTFEEYIGAQREQGKAVDLIAADLRDLTGIPLVSRTLYRWVSQLEKETT